MRTPLKEFVRGVLRKSKWIPDLQKYKYQTKYLRKLEFEIARGNNKMDQHIEKWTALNDIM
jgi:hypothetical protein